MATLMEKDALLNGASQCIAVFIKYRRQLFFLTSSGLRR